MTPNARKRLLRRASALLAAGILLLAGVPLTASDADTEPDPRQVLVERGEFLYGIYCANCHGEAARGDGPLVTELKTRPSDLTLLSARNGGVFPFAEVYDTIDGRESVTGHGQREMPVWGFAFQELDKDTSQEAEVAERIRQLVEYLESIQSR